MYSWSNANNLKFTCYENGKRIVIYDVCQIARDYRTGNEWLNDLHTTNYGLNREYDSVGYNCVQVSIEVLLKGSFYKEYNKYKDKMETYNLNCIPNLIFNELKGL